MSDEARIAELEARVQQLENMQAVLSYGADFMRIGADVGDPDKTPMVIALVDADYNGETLGKGDMLIGSNSSGKANLHYKAADEQWRMRGGTTVMAFVDTNGTLTSQSDTVRINDDGIELSADDADANSYKIMADADPTESVMRLYTKLEASRVETYLRSRGSTSDTIDEAYLNLEAKTASGSPIAGVATATIELETATDRISYSTHQHRFGRTSILGIINKTGITDNVATDCFTITTTNESGSNDGGSYSCIVNAMISHGATAANTDTAVKNYRGRFARYMLGAGTGANSAVEDTFTGTSVASTPANKDINTVVMSVVETTEYVQTIQFQIDLTGAAVTTAEVDLEILVLYSGFSTPPVIGTV